MRVRLTGRTAVYVDSSYVCIPYVDTLREAQLLLETPLTALHQMLGAKLVPFAGYSMPISYPGGIIAEHNHTRSQSGLFDVSHMGQVTVLGDAVAERLESVMPNNFISLAPMSSVYGLLMNEAGGVRDDLIATNLGDGRFNLVLNASNKHADLAYLRAALPDLTFELHEDRALMALQGPASRAVMARLGKTASGLGFMTAAQDQIDGIDVWVTCSGYTGEDGFEISVSASEADRLAQCLLAEPEVEAIGLGARDSLRLEAGLCLHGHELSADITPIEAGLNWAIARERRESGSRPGGYPGAAIIHQQLSEGVARKRVGLRVEGRRPVRAGETLLDNAGNEVGVICSDAFGASVGRPVAMAFVQPACSQAGSDLHVMVRGKRVDLTVVKLPMVPNRYYRG
jgi:aminomethyltransferase